MNELDRLSRLCDAALLAVDYDPEQYQPVHDPLPHALAEKSAPGGKLAGIRRRLALGFYTEEGIREKIISKLADDLLKNRSEEN